MSSTAVFRIWCIAALLYCVIDPQAALAQAPPAGVFSELQTALIARPSTVLEPGTLRSRVVQVDTQKITAARRGREVLKLNLFDDAVVEVQIKRVRPTRSGYFISGRPKGMEWGAVRLVVNGPVMVGTVETPEGKFTIRSGGSGRHVIRQIDPSKELLECEVQTNPLFDPSSLPAISSIDPPSSQAFPPSPQNDDIPTEDGSEVRVLILYTPALQTRQGGSAGIRALIDLMIQSANQAFEDSGISPRLVLAHSALVDYVAQKSGTDLIRLINEDDGYMDEVHALRNKHAADLVHLLTEDTSGPAGSATRFFRESLLDDQAFAVTATANEETFTHETGHNFGLRHDRFVNSPNGAIYPYAFGYINKKAFESDAPIQARWRTVMAYGDGCSEAGFGCPRLFRFSNPDQTHLGDPLGVPANDPATGPYGPADARLAVNNTARWVGSFRSEACTEFAVSPEAPIVPRDGGHVGIQVNAKPGCLWQAASQSDFLEVTSSLPGAGSGSVTIEIKANQTGAERVGNLIVAGNAITIRQLATTEGVCGRTAAVMHKIATEAGFTGAEQCSRVTDDDLARITRLSLNRGILTSLKDGDFDGLSGMTRLSLVSNDLNELPEDLFSGLTSLISLSLGYNQLTELPAGLFSNLGRLESLGLNSNRLTELPTGIFAGLSNLQKLHLDYNDLVRLSPDVFADLSRLEELFLNSNELEELPKGLLNGLSNLRKLDLSHNQVTELPDGLFAGLSNLEELRLFLNYIADLPASTFSGLSNLKTLDLGRGQFETLPRGLFADLSKLERLNFWDGQLTSLPSDAFSGLSNLQELDLYSNHLSGVPAGLFAGFAKLRQLNLGGNQINSLPPGLFSGLSSLGELNLYRNQLSSLPDGVFAGLASLDTLYLAGNAVDPLALSLSIEKAGDSRFKAVAAAGAPFPLFLPVIVNEGGMIGDDADTITIPLGAVESEPLDIMRVEGNDQAVNVDFGVLPGLPENHSGYVLGKDQDLPRWILTSNAPADATLIELLVSDGNLDPSFSPENSNYSVRVANAVSVITITPTTSNARATAAFFGAGGRELADADAGTDGHQLSVAAGDSRIEVLITAADGQAQERYVLTITREESNCERTEQILTAILEAVPEVDACGELTRSHLSAITELNLDGLGISSLKAGDFSGLGGLESLRLTDNLLTGLPQGVFSGLRALRSLGLRQNQMTQLPADVFSDLSSLRSLYLSENKLRTVPDGIFSGLNAIEEIWLQENELTSVHAELFAGLSRLRFLPLSSNRLASVPADLFSGLTSLRDLWLGRNELESLPAELFSGLSAMTKLMLNDNELTSLPAGIFSDLPELEYLWLERNKLTSLPDDVFSGLFKLQYIWLHGNQLTSLPDGVFSGMKLLRLLALGQDDGVLPLALSLEKSGERQFKAVVPSGVPIRLEIPISVSSSGMLDGDADTVVILAGELRSSPVTVTRVNDATHAVTVDIGTIPGLPRRHSGYEFRKSGQLPLEILAAVRADDASLNDLTVSAGTLDSAFSSAVPGYTAVVANAISSVTASATPNNPMARVDFLDAADQELADANTSLGGHQMNLGIGENTIKVKVTSQDGTETRTYVIVVIRDGAAGVCSRTAQVRDAIVASVSGVSECALVTDAHLSRITALELSGDGILTLKAGDFAQLTALNSLRLENNQLRILPAELFSGLSALTTLRLDGNQLRALPEGFFSGLTMLHTLDLSGNPVDPLSLRVSLEKAGDGKFKAVSPAGAPFALVLPIGVNAAGLIESGARTVTIPAGAVESAALGVSRKAGLEEGVIVDIGALPTLPQNHKGYALEKHTDLPLEISLPQVVPPPAQVTGVVVAVGIELLDVTWTTVSDANGYRVQWKSGSQRYDETRQSEVAGGDTTSYTVTGLTPGTQYTIRVLATKENAEDGPPSEEVTGIPKESRPAQVTGVAVISGVDELEVTWTAVSDADGYKVQWKSDEEDYDEDRQALLTGMDAVSHTIPDLAAGTEYTVRVIATINNADDGMPSSEVTGIPKSAPPAQVTGVELTADVEQLDVSWMAVSDADGYKVQWKSGSEDYDEARQVALLGGETTSYTIIDLTVDTEYTIRVIATKDYAEDGAPSEEVTGIPKSMSPDQVMGVAVVVGVEQLEVSWEVVSGADGYKVQWKSGDEAYDEARQAVIPSGDTLSHTIADLSGGTEYTVRVLATKDNADDGLPSNEVTGIPTSQPPAQVTGVAVEPGFEELAVSWDAVSDADGYEVQWKSGSEDYNEARQVALLGGETTSYTIIDLTVDTEYTVRVIATKEYADDGPPSEEVTATLANPDPDVNADGTLDGDDAQVMYQAYASEERVGDGESGGTAESRRTLLSGLAATANPSDDDLKAMLRRANVWRSVGVAVGGDINEDGAIDGDDAFVMYYAYEFADLLGDGETGGTARHRQHLLSSRSSKDNPTDQDLKRLLRRANALRDEFG